ncbi:unnamed protein product [Ectocarpus sp. 12 AP-2014]
MMTFTILLRADCSRVMDARFVLAIVAVILAVADAFHVRASIPLRTIAIPRRLPWARTASSGDTTVLMMSTATASTTTKTTAAVTPEAALDPIIQELRARIVEAPEPLEGNRESQRHADRVISTTFEVDCDGNLLGGEGQELRLASALARETFVVVRVRPKPARACLRRLGKVAEQLLGESRTVEEKVAAFGPIRAEGQFVSGYAGGGDYGSGQFLETRGIGGEEIVPRVDGDAVAGLIEGRRALTAISGGILQAVLRQSLPEIDPAAFLGLVDPGEGRQGVGGSSPKMSASPLRMCRYAGGGDGVAFGTHTDTTFLTVIPCASAPGLEIIQPSTGRWVRPEASRDCRPGSDVMLLAGELLQVFGRGRYQAAVHRVVRPAGSTEPRVSTPLLLRGIAGAAIRGSMLPPAVAARLERRSEEAKQTRREIRRAAGGSSSKEGEEGGELNMTDLWAALQFRGGATPESSSGGHGWSGEISDSLSSPPPLAQAKTTDQIRECFEPYARDGVAVLSVDPLLVRLRGFASPGQCSEIIDQGMESLEQSTTWGGAGAQTESDALRRSATTWLADDCLAPLLGRLTERVSGMSGLPSAFMENWQVARYRPDGYFKLHTDHVEDFNSLVCGGRLGTLILYLNDDFTGGQTDFPFVHVAVAPFAGDAIYFHSVQVRMHTGRIPHTTREDKKALVNTRNLASAMTGCVVCVGGAIFCGCAVLCGSEGYVRVDSFLRN